jgi:hypothetical protein
LRFEIDQWDTPSRHKECEMKATAFWLIMAGGSVAIGYAMALMMELL